MNTQWGGIVTPFNYVPFHLKTSRWPVNTGRRLNFSCLHQATWERKEIMGIFLSSMCHFPASSSHFLRLCFNCLCALIRDTDERWRRLFGMKTTRQLPKIYVKTSSKVLTAKSDDFSETMDFLNMLMKDH